MFGSCSGFPLYPRDIIPIAGMDLFSNPSGTRLQYKIVNGKLKVENG
jgi:hypothetical protein